MNGIRVSGDFKPINAYKKTLGLSKTQFFVTVEHYFSFSILKTETNFLWKLDIVL